MNGVVVDMVRTLISEISKLFDRVDQQRNVRQEDCAA